MTIIYPIKDLNNKNTEEYEEGTPWNKGLTKETDERIKKQSEKIKGKNNGAVKYLKGKTYEEIYGSKEKAKEIIEKKKKNYNMMNSATINLKGRTYKDIYGPEKAKEQKEKRRMKTQEKYNNKTATFGFPTDGTMKIKRANQIFPIKDTSIELKIQDYLKQLKIGFFTHYYCKEIEHSYQCDIFIPVQKNKQRFIREPIIIECDGDYFHGNINHPRYKILTQRQIEQREEDKIRTKELQEKGFKVIRLWESDINKLNLENFNNICNGTN